MALFNLLAVLIIPTLVLGALNDPGVAIKRSDDTAGRHRRSHLLKSLRPNSELAESADKRLGDEYRECPSGFRGWYPNCWPEENSVEYGKRKFKTQEHD